MIDGDAAQRGPEAALLAHSERIGFKGAIDNFSEQQYGRCKCVGCDGHYWAVTKWLAHPQQAATIRLPEPAAISPWYHNKSAVMENSAKPHAWKGFSVVWGAKDWKKSSLQRIPALDGGFTLLVARHHPRFGCLYDPRLGSS